jgi:low affinity Fe/Cu permease
MTKKFNQFATWVAHATGTWVAFALALAVVVVWFVAGFFVGFQDTFYQLIINTGTTIITFLMVFNIQNTQNRDTKALQLKLDAIILAIEEAQNEVIDIEEAEPEQIELIKGRIEQAAKQGGSREGE